MALSTSPVMISSITPILLVFFVMFLAVYFFPKDKETKLKEAIRKIFHRGAPAQNDFYKMTGIQAIIKRLFVYHRCYLELSAWFFLVAAGVGGSYIAHDILHMGGLFSLLFILLCIAIVFCLEALAYPLYCLIFEFFYCKCVAKEDGAGKVDSGVNALPLVRKLIQANRFVTALSAWIFLVGGFSVTFMVSYVLTDGRSPEYCALFGMLAVVAVFLLEALLYPPYCVVVEALYRNYQKYEK